MKRDMELIRKLVLILEDDGDPNQLAKEGYTNEQIGHHAYLMIQAGLAEGHPYEDFQSSSPQALLSGLTWEGHEFAAVAHNESIWKSAIDQINKLGGGAVTLGILIPYSTCNPFLRGQGTIATTQIRYSRAPEA